MKKVLTSIGIALLGIILFSLSYFIVVLLIGLLFLLLDAIPLINKLVALLFSIRKDSPDMLAMLVGTVIAYNVCKWLIAKLSGDAKVFSLSCVFSGGTILAFNILFFVINIISNSTVLANIFFAIAGIIILLTRKDYA